MVITRTRRSYTVAAAAITVLASLTLSGCAAEQSKDEACDHVRSGLDTVQTELTANLGAYEEDPAAAVEAIDALAATFAENVSHISNSEVKGPADNTQAVLSTMAEQFSTFVDDPEAEENAELFTTAADLETSFATLGEVCS